MSGTWGEYVKLSLFGESHGKCVGIVINGLPAGIKLDLDFIRSELARRAPGKNALSTPRQEKDEFEIISGYFNEHTTGSPLTFIIWNKDSHSNDYEDLKYNLRPGHADYTAMIKHGGFNDYRGGGHFSGRLTASMVLAGAIAKQILSKKEIAIGGHVLSIGNIREESFDELDLAVNSIQELARMDFPVLNSAIGEEMQQQILLAKAEEDSLGGIVETAAIGLPVGVGSPFFDSLESKIAHLLFSIPAVKGVEFGAGFAITQMKGSQANDSFVYVNSRVETLTNHNGGILGGISNGMPLLFRTALKPTPSIAKAQSTVDISRNEEVEIRVKGRHDPCIVPRAVPVVESAAALAILDLMIEKDGVTWMI
ncbi:chorismate synthase [Dehalobacter sp. DCM]|uniref:chorismate synthase n=1 Tax=Dehalobacter sp. DCM TaxID=2907827 RepID=UPI003081B13A|nr:chorismate synthase [Dehalobacter sp. DCM]